MDRIDNIISKIFNISRSRVKKYIDERKIEYLGRLVLKANEKVLSCTREDFKILEDINYVSRASYKLLKAIKIFNIQIEGLVCLDIGASTGGFSQVLLENNAKKVIALDVGTNQIDEKLLLDNRLVSIENMDIRDVNVLKLEKEYSKIALVVTDVSFISLKNILEKLREIHAKNYMLLIKPQFEVGKDIATRHKGIVLDKKVHKKVIMDLINLFSFLKLEGLDFSPNKSKNGNIEYISYWTYNEKTNDKEDKSNLKDEKEKLVENVIDNAFLHFNNKNNCTRENRH